MIKEAAEKIVLEISVQEDEKAKNEADLKKLDVALGPLYDEHKKATATEAQLRTISTDRGKVERELEIQRANAEKLSRIIKKIFDGSEPELVNEIKRFKADHATKVKQLHANEEKSKTLDVERRSIDEKLKSCHNKQYGFISQREQEQDLYDGRAERLGKICQKLEIAVDFDINNDNKRATQLIGDVKTKMTSEKDVITDLITSHEQINKEQEENVQQIINQDVKITSEIAMYDKTLQDKNKESEKNSENIKKCESSRKQLAEMELKLTKVMSALKSIKDDTNIKQIEEQIKANRAKRTEMNDELEGLDMTIGMMSAMSKSLAEIASKEQHIAKRESDKRRIKNKHIANLQKLFPNETIESNFRKQIETLNQKMRTEHNALEAKTKINDRKLQELLCQLRSKKDEKQKCEDEIRRLQPEIDDMCETIPFDELLETTKENVSKYQMELSSLESTVLINEQ